MPDMTLTEPETTIKGPAALAAHAHAIESANAAYATALAELQATCEHRTVLRYEGVRYTAHRVCEDCGLSCRANWDSPVHVTSGDPILMGKRYYAVSWQEFCRALPVVTADNQGH